MPASQLSNCENFPISFERKYNKEMNGKKHVLFRCFKIASGFFFWIRRELIMCIFKLLNSMRFFSHLQQFALQQLLVNRFVTII